MAPTMNRICEGGARLQALRVGLQQVGGPAIIVRRHAECSRTLCAERSKTLRAERSKAQRPAE